MLGILSALAAGAITIVGVLAFGWSATTVLALFWVESALETIGHTIRLTRHRALPSRFAADSTNPRRDFLTVALPFLVAHGLAVACIALALSNEHPGDARWAFDAGEWLSGSALLAILIGLELAADLRTIATRSSEWLRAETLSRLRRSLVLQFTVIFGLLAVGMTDQPASLVLVLVAAKTLAEVWSRARRPALAASEETAR